MGRRPLEDTPEDNLADTPEVIREVIPDDTPEDILKSTPEDTSLWKIGGYPGRRTQRCVPGGHPRGHLGRPTVGHPGGHPEDTP